MKKAMFIRLNGQIFSLVQFSYLCLQGWMLLQSEWGYAQSGSCYLLHVMIASLTILVTPLGSIAKETWVCVLINHLILRKNSIQRTL